MINHVDDGIDDLSQIVGRNVRRIPCRNPCRSIDQEVWKGGRQNGWLSANDIRELEDMNRISAEQGGDTYLVNGNMLPLDQAGKFYTESEGKNK